MFRGNIPTFCRKKWQNHQATGTDCSKAATLNDNPAGRDSSDLLKQWFANLLHIGITWGTFQAHRWLAPVPVQFNQNLWWWVQVLLCLRAFAADVLMCRDDNSRQFGLLRWAAIAVTAQTVASFYFGGWGGGAASGLSSSARDPRWRMRDLTHIYGI